MTLFNNKITELPSGAFKRLDALKSLILTSNQIPTLPDGSFEDLSALTSVEFDNNTGSPFTLTAGLKAKGTGVAVSIDEGAPATVSVTLSASGGTLPRHRRSPSPPECWRARSQP